MLPAGTRIGTYEIVAPLGAGGMGEVYRARDATLKREVALKLLPAAFTADLERLARFQREAEMLAALNHPHIAQIYGVQDGPPAEASRSISRALVMELVEGETLADRIARGRIPVDESLSLARQIADALEAAHERGIVHRDLKPANIRVTPDGVVKVLDFGLAKALESGPGEPVSPDAATFSPTTISPAITMQGVILGTAAYMSPEQAKGRSTDRRTDIWAFGCVLFEMLTGMRAFAGDDVADTMVAILSREPDWSRLPPDATAVRPLLARCLQRDVRQRLQSIGEARIQLDDFLRNPPGASTASAATGYSGRTLLVTAVAAAAVAALAAAAGTWMLMTPPPAVRAKVVRFEIVPPATLPLANHVADRNVAISPDGQFIVFRAGEPPNLFVRAIDGREATRLEGTGGARSPFFSPDGVWIGFFDGTRLRKVSVAGGAPITICESAIPRGASWGEDGTIVFTTPDTATGLLRVPATGGEPEIVTTPDPAKGERDHGQPWWLPAARGVLFTIVPLDPSDPKRIAVLDLRNGERKVLVQGSHAEYVETGHLLYAAEGDVFAVRFDSDRLEVRGDPAPLVADVLMNVEPEGYGEANFGVSRQGTLVYVEAESGAAPRSLAWVDRTGREARVPAPSRMYVSSRLSPDGSRLAVEIRDQQRDIHVLDLKQGTLTRLAPGPSAEMSPIWTADGRHIVFASQRDQAFNLYMQAADGSGTVRRLTHSPNSQRPAWVAPDGRGILAAEISPKTAGDVIWVPLDAASTSSLPGATASSSVQRLVQSPAIDYLPDVSPDGRYLAYQSNESGQEEIFVRPFPNVNDGVWSVSTGGGMHPVWARNGRELYYLDPTSTLVAVPVQPSGAALRFGNPARLFQLSRHGPYNTRQFDVAADGRFLVVKPSESEQKPPGLVVVVNWVEELRERLPPGP